jgi:hypothetical protein
MMFSVDWPPMIHHDFENARRVVVCLQYHGVRAVVENVRNGWRFLRKMHAMTLTELRKNIYTVFDEVLKTGKAVVIESKGRIVLILPGCTGGKIERFRKSAPPKAIIDNPDELIHFEWEKEWLPRHI